MFESIVALGVIGWIAFVVTIVTLLGAVITFKTSRNGLSFGWTVIFVALLIFTFHEPLLGVAKGFTVLTDKSLIIDWVALSLFATKALSFWVIGAAVTAVLFWLSFVKDVKTAYHDRLEAATLDIKAKFKDWSTRAQTSVAKGVAIGSGSNNVFGALNFFLPIPSTLRREAAPSLLNVDWQSLSGDPTPESIDSNSKLDELDAAIAKVLPPRIKHFKLDVSYAATFWPITLMSLLFSDLLRHILDFILSFWHRALDAASAKVFGAV